jgi:ATP-dependent protease ClpP protease subunit
LSSRFLLRNFDEETLKEFLEFSKEEGDKVILLSSCGGSAAACGFISDIINESPEEYTIHVSEYALSAGLSILLHTTCKLKEVGTKYQIPMEYLWHSMKVGKGSTIEQFKRTEELSYIDFNTIKHVLTEKQIKIRDRYVFWTYRFGFRWLKKFMDDDIILTRDQVKELLGDRFE